MTLAKASFAISASTIGRMVMTRLMTWAACDWRKQSAMRFASASGWLRKMAQLHGNSLARQNRVCL